MVQRSGSIRVALIASAKSATHLSKSVEDSQMARLVSVETDPSPSRGLFDRLRAKSPDVILVETLEEESGVRLLQHLKAQSANAWLLVTSDLSDPSLIIRMVRAGAREFLAQPVSVQSLTDAFERYLEETREWHLKTKKGALYTVTSAKHGAGATSVALNLAAAIAGLPGTRVCLVDLGFPLGDIATYLDLKPEMGIADTLAAGERLDPVLLESYMVEKSGTSILAGWSDYEHELPDSARLKAILELIRENFTHAVIDASGNPGLPHFKAVTEASDNLVLVLTPDLPAIAQTYRLMNLFEYSDPDRPFWLALNRAGSKVEVTTQDVERSLKNSMKWVLPNDHKLSLDATRQGKPAISFKRSKLAKQYFRMASQLTGIPMSSGQRGILGLFTPAWSES